MSLLFITLKDSVLFSAPFLLGLHPCILLNTILSMRRLQACVGLGQMCGRNGIVICFVLPFDVFPAVIHVWKGEWCNNESSFNSSLIGRGSSR